MAFRELGTVHPDGATVDYKVDTATHTAMWCDNGAGPWCSHVAVLPDGWTGVEVWSWLTQGLELPGPEESNEWLTFEGEPVEDCEYCSTILAGQ